MISTSTTGSGSSKNPRTTHPDVILAIFLSLGYLVGILSPHHLFPSTSDFLVSLEVMLFVSMGCGYWLLKSSHNAVKSIPVSSVFWLLLLGLVCIQPLFHNISYMDGLIFEAVVLLVCSLTAWIVSNVTHKVAFTNLLAIGVAIGAALTFFIILLQYFHVELNDNIFFKRPRSGRLYGNVAQPNQAAFILVLGMFANVYLARIKPTKGIIIFSVVMVSLYASGVALTISRTGIVLMLLFVLLSALLFSNSLKHRFMYMVALATMCVLGYIFGSFLQQLDTTVMYSSSVERFTDSTINLRWYQLQQAWLLFTANPLTGVGWGNYGPASFAYAEQLPWFSFSGHSHFFLSQLASELGVLGILVTFPLAYVLLKKLSFQLADHQAVSLGLILLTLAYSCSEFPLWLFRYLLLFCICVALLDDTKFKVACISSLTPKFFMVMNLLIIVGCVYYAINYRDYRKTAYVVMDSQMSYSEKKRRMANLKPVPGFSEYHDSLTFLLMKTNKENLQAKIELAETVLPKQYTYNFLMKTAGLYALSGDYGKTLQMAKFACLINFGRHCAELKESLKKQSTSSQSKLVTKLYLDIERWDKTRVKNKDMKKHF